MKILDKEQIRQADTYTIENESIKSIDLMERASRAFVHQFVGRFHPDTPVKVFAGKGNNGGDGLAIARLLLNHGYRVTAYVVQFTDKASQDFQVNRSRLEKMNAGHIIDLYEHTELPVLNAGEVVIDAMWGSGLDRPIKGFARNVIQMINESDAHLVAVDIPSGVYCDGINDDEVKIRADYTYTFQLPKLAFFLPEEQDYTGEFKILDIGLDQEFINYRDTPYYFVNQTLAKPFLKKRKKFQHKGHFGHSLVMAGAYGKIGAAVIMAKACLRSGSGLLTVYTPACGYQPVQTAFPEAMVLSDINHDIISTIPDTTPFDVIGIGPGIGQDQQTVQAFEKLLDVWKGKMVLDADALNILSEQKSLWQKLPKQAILTPHPGEFDRLTGNSKDSLERLDKLKNLSKDTDTVVVLKGAHTAIAVPSGKVYFNSTGHPGMATAGCGDALTGIITGLSAQGYEPEQAAVFGVYLHGLAGDLAGCDKGMEGLITRDLIEHLPDAYKQLHSEPKRL